jgi:hypothetical protein
VYNADKVYLFDAEERALREVEMPMLCRSSRWRWGWFMAGVAVGAFLMVFLGMFTV